MSDVKVSVTNKDGSVNTKVFSDDELTSGAELAYLWLKKQVKDTLDE